MAKHFFLAVSIQIIQDNIPRGCVEDLFGVPFFTNLWYPD